MEALTGHRMHIELAHPYVCELCPEAYPAAYVDQAALTRHIDEVHGNRRFQCAGCEKSFYRRHRLKAHMAANHPEMDISEGRDTSVQEPTEAIASAPRPPLEERSSAGPSSTPSTSVWSRSNPLLIPQQSSNRAIDPRDDSIL